MRRINRKSAPKVVGGQVQLKNNWTETPNIYNTESRFLEVFRKRPGKGFRHLLKQRDIHDFIGIIPDWNDLSQGLDAIVLAPGDWDTFGYHTTGVVHVCAWDADLWMTMTPDGFEREREIYERLGVPTEVVEDGILCKFTESTARGHQLLATLLHEIGHHHDRITTRSKYRTARGEGYAERFATEYTDRMWERFVEVFGLPE
jgi:hypothetical protein